MIPTALDFDIYDRCERRFAFTSGYTPNLISLLGVLYAAVEVALLSDDPEESAKAETMRLASTRDLILGDLNKFMTVRHVGYLAAIIALALRSRLGPLHRIDPTSEWKSALFETKSGTRHRIELVSHLDDDRLRSLAHSWRVLGELAMLQTPITLTTVVIGPQRGGRRHSEWSKALRHPVSKQLRFALRNNKKSGFSDGWEKVWREQESLPTAKWLSQMKLDGVLDQLIVSREIAYNASDNRMIAARQEMEEVKQAMTSASPSAPMRRSSCDEFGGCPFQAVCYSPTPAAPASFPHLYSLRDKPLEELEEYMSLRHTAASSHPVPAALAASGLLVR